MGIGEGTRDTPGEGYVMTAGEIRRVQPWTAPSLTVLLPALNERETLGPTIDRLLRALNLSIEDFEIIIVDDGSTDGTGEIADRLASQHPEIRTVHNPRNMGLGYSYLRGIDLASKNFFVYLPADNTWPFRSLVELFGSMGKSDIVTSYATNPEVRAPSRRVVSRWYTNALNLLFGRRLHYYNGLTIYPITFLRSRLITTYGFGFQAEVLLKGMNRGLSLVEVPLQIDERTASGSKAVTVKNIVSVVITIARLVWDLRLSRRLSLQPRLSKPSPNDGSSLWESGAPARNRAGTASGPGAPAAGTGDGRQEPLRILITGASAGIGAALMEALAADGHILFVCARRGAMLDQATRQNTLARGRACDVSDEDQVREFIAWVRTHTPYLDVLINCAGTMGAIGAAESVDSQEWWETVRVNLFGTYVVTKHALPLLKQSRDARILNFAGGGAFGPNPNYSAYACSKAAVVRLTECLAAELAPIGIPVNAVAPGFVATEIHRATLLAGAERAGTLAYRRTKALMEAGTSQIGNVADCVRSLLSPQMRGLAGKTISVHFDPWRTAMFQNNIPAITRSDLYAMRRINIANLPEGALRQRLEGAAAVNRDTRSP